MKIFYYMMMTYHDRILNLGLGLEDSIKHLNEYAKFKRLYEKR